MFKPLVKLLRKPTLLEIVVTQLAETEFELLSAKASQEKASAEIAWYTARIKRLQKHIQESTLEVQSPVN